MADSLNEKVFDEISYNQKIIEARSYIKKTFEINPVDHNLFIKAIDLYHEALNIDETKVEPYMSLAYIFWKMNKSESAIRFLKTALTFNPDNFPVMSLFNEIKKYEDERSATLSLDDLMEED